MLAAAPGAIRCMRDPTRGGLSSALNEIAAQSRVGMLLDEKVIPVREEVRGACELLGLDPLYVANEGKLIAIVAPDSAEYVLAAMRSHPLGERAELIGTVTDAHPGMVAMRTLSGRRASWTCSPVTSCRGFAEVSGFGCRVKKGSLTPDT